MAGWIKLHRKLKKWGWANKPNMVSLFVWLLMEAKTEECVYNGVKLLPGQVIFSYRKWEEKTGISIQSLRTCIAALKSTQEITHISTQPKNILTIVNWEYYQSKSKTQTHKSTQKPTRKSTLYKEDISEDISSKEGKEGREAHAREAAPIFDKSFYISLLKRKERGEPLTPQEKAYMQAYEKKLLGSSKAKQPTPEETQQALLEAAQWKQSKGIPLTASEEKLLKGEGK